MIFGIYMFMLQRMKFSLIQGLHVWQVVENRLAAVHPSMTKYSKKKKRDVGIIFSCFHWNLFAGTDLWPT